MSGCYPVYEKCAHGVTTVFQDCEICKLETRIMIQECCMDDLRKRIEKLEKHNHLDRKSWCPTCNR